MRRVFRSIQHPDKYGYAFDSEAWSTRGATVNQNFVQFETYGDGLCQHSHEWPITVEFMADYLASLATAMLQDDELIQRLSFPFSRQPSVKQIEFCASVVFKPQQEDGGWEKKQRFFSIEQLKISSSEEKRHDKRYQQVERWCDGSATAIHRMLYREFDNALEIYARAEAIREWCLEGERNERPYMGLAVEFLEWFKTDPERRQKAQDMRRAYGACVAICKAYVLRSEAETHLENIRPAKPVESVKPDESEVA